MLDVVKTLDKRYQKKWKVKDLTGQNFGRLTVVSLDSVNYDTNVTMWNCVCICGNKIKTRGHSLIYNTTKSCGCLIKTWMKELTKRNRLSKGEAGLNELYKCYKANATKRKLDFQLTKEEFKLITSSNCYYCGTIPKQFHSYKNKAKMSEEGKQNAIYIHNGVDRIINNIGYTIENSVSCCKICNRAKSNMDYSEFIEWINQIKLYNSPCQIVN